MPLRRRRLIVGATIAALSAPGLSACSSSTDPQVRLGYFPNLTHATAIIGIDRGYFEAVLKGDNASLTTQTFNSGSDTVSALLSGGLDATFIGPSPALTAFVQSHGSAVRIVSGAASGGAALVVQPNISSIAQLKGQKVATPGLGNTQDVAARYYFKSKGFTTDQNGGGDISIVPQDNSVTLQAFQQKQIAGAWVPEPYASLLVHDGGKVLVNESSLWPQGRFVTTQLLVRTQFLKDHPNLVADLVKATVQANQFINAHSDQAKTIVGEQLVKLTQSKLAASVLTSAWGNLTFTDDPLASTLSRDAKHAESVGLLSDVPPVSGLYDLSPLNNVLKSMGKPEVATP
ncbi:MAG: ABC transporter substrate-binding protein [Nocardioidaceae bacterium]